MVVYDPDEQLDWNDPNLNEVVENLPLYDEDHGESLLRDLETSPPVRRRYEEGVYGAMRTYGQAVWSGRIVWGDPLPNDLVTDREE